ncbi:bifunctional diaminohydroxyphosphoribosylaminopyrimidine deaminase/5-amino-6-(5-phosphoribosylamino)uracil reductase RibD [Demequina sp. B12]|uniref:bifunctional diaminohydroxyphosphoribosylaminopyrimidine deaminase/5-amino-6-(5-phosphoribosylamino)uracil reductase RibD n=1 Tax=Demequina sp. B12 TaxID=2992757 RepID=UPI00237ACECF|nr:bifunctional diaminohydroxyphosphoribosylaminopyrimidine deaminase/5-amino-6-(5-phosphoribosylamino)uracil reductase RibD [Demequina sp. B12]MDE0573070.1 bifunctional diaminohydroxyphosphoribosylaminopyrimidine deaminase/5-amino-6-(5-phosphoribosylamino)uracil reductase RibD [Demequina sp. B12]
MSETTPVVTSGRDAMDRAVVLAQRGPAYGPNPQVGCVIVSGGQDPTAAGVVVGEGWHRGAGTAHAEVAALADAVERGNDVRGARAYVTLEPCNHVGRTGPCADALTAAGIGDVVYAVADPGDASSGGAATLRSRGIGADLVGHDGAKQLTRRWHRAMSLHRPYVIAKWASTLDGRMAAADGTSFWITGTQAREHAHGVRAVVDAIAVGTGTVTADNPSLSARPGGVEQGHQPLRVVVGQRSTPGAAVWRDSNAMQASTHDPAEVLAELWAREVRTVVVEGGPTLLSAFFAAGLVDEVNAYLAPAIVGAGPTSLADLGISTMADALRLRDVTFTPLGADILVTGFLTEGT